MAKAVSSARPISLQIPNTKTPLVDLQTGLPTAAWRYFLGNIESILDTYGTPMPGDLLVRGSSVWQYVAPGSVGQVLTMGATLPSWAAPAATWTTVHKPSDQSVTSSTTLVDDNDLHFSVAANTRYIWRCQLMFGTSVTGGGAKIGFTGPTSPTYVLIGDVNSAVGSGVTGVTISSFTTLDHGNIDQTYFVVFGYLQNGANSGTVQLQFAQQASNATPTTLLQGSYLEWMQV